MSAHVSDPADDPARRSEGPAGQPVGRPVPDWRGAAPPAPTVLCGDVAMLEPLGLDHSEALHAAFAKDASGRLWTYMGQGPFAAPAEYAAWVAGAAGQPDPMFFWIGLHDGAPVGVAALMRIQPAAGVIEIGSITIAPEHQRTRAATEGLFVLMRHAIDDLGYRRLEWKCDALNARSRRAALRLGFRFEGIFLNALVYKGRNRDTAWYAITDEEWPSRRDAIEAWLDPANFGADGRQRCRLGAERRTPDSPETD